MKFQLHFKTPDVTDQLKFPGRLTEDEQERAEAVIEKFVNFGEYIHIEFDTETETATVVPQ